MGLLMVLAMALAFTACGHSSDNPGSSDNPIEPVAPTQIEDGVRPVVFVHGGAGSASQFESQAQRFLANGYPLSYLGVYEYNTRLNPDDQIAANDAGINAVIDRLLEQNDADRVDLIGHSMGTQVSQNFLSTPANAARVAHYVNVDGRPAEAQPGDVRTLALWGMASADQEIVGAVNDHNAEQSHIQVCTSAESFVKMYSFFTGEAPETSAIPPSTADQVQIAGRANIFPENIGAAGRTLKIYAVDPATGFRIAPETPVAELAIGADGAWGPVAVDKGVPHEFALEHDTVENSDHLFFREPFLADDYFIRLNTSEPGSGVGNYLIRSANHTNLAIGRDKEMWGDQAAGNDILTVDGENVLTPEAAAQDHRLSMLFLFDAGPEELDTGRPDPAYDGVTNLSAPNTFFHSLPFISGLDLFIPAAAPADRTIAIVLTPRGGDGATQTIRVPNWSSDVIRSISVQFRDFVQE
jgi:pimeloyl-ACP methyl ester carboxylesterase